MLTNIRRSKIEDGTQMDENIMTIAEERKAEQDRLLNIGDERSGTRGSTYFGSKFNKNAEKAARAATWLNSWRQDVVVLNPTALPTLGSGPWAG